MVGNLDDVVRRKPVGEIRFGFLNDAFGEQDSVVATGDANDEAETKRA